MAQVDTLEQYSAFFKPVDYQALVRETYIHFCSTPLCARPSTPLLGPTAGHLAAAAAAAAQ
jgi:hypothetical protein